jgi:hypothetical protein
MTGASATLPDELLLRVLEHVMLGRDGRKEWRGAVRRVSRTWRALHAVEPYTVHAGTRDWLAEELESGALRAAEGTARARRRAVVAQHVTTWDQRHRHLVRQAHPTLPRRAHQLQLRPHLLRLMAVYVRAQRGAC